MNVFSQAINLKKKFLSVDEYGNFFGAARSLSKRTLSSTAFMASINCGSTPGTFVTVKLTLVDDQGLF